MTKIDDVKKEAVKAPEAAKVEAPKAVKAEAPKAAAKKAPAKKPAAKKAPAKKAAAKKAPAKKAAPAAKAEDIFAVQFAGGEWTMADLKAKAVAASGKKTAKKVAIYVKPEEGKAYCVINDKDEVVIDL